MASFSDIPVRSNADTDLVDASWWNIIRSKLVELLDNGVLIPSLTTAERDALSPSAGLIIYNTDTGKVNVYDGANWGELAGSGGEGGVNFFEGGDFETNTDLVTLFNESSYTDGTGGTVAALSKSQNTTTPLAGDADLKITKAASDASGDGFTFTSTTIDKRYKTKKLWFKGYADLSDADYTSGDIKMHAYDVTNGSTIPFRAVAGILEDNTLPNYETDLLGYVIVPSGCEEIRISGHIASDSTTGTGWDAHFDDMKLTPDASALGVFEKYEEIDLTGSGDFTAGKIAVSKVGRQVTVTASVDITHSSSSGPNSASGAIPDWAAPDANKGNIFRKTTSVVQEVFVQSDGTLSFRYHDWAGSATNQTSSTTQWTLSYTVSESSTFAMSATEVNLSRVKARYTTDAGQSIPSGTPTIVNFEDIDRDEFNTVTTGASWKFTATKTNWYDIAAKIKFANNAWSTGDRLALYLYKNGSNISELSWNTVQTGSTVFLGVGGSDQVYLEKDDEIDIRVFQNSGSSVSFNTDSTNNYVSIVEQPDETFFGAYGETEIISASSSSFPLTTSGYSSLEWAQMTGNSVELTPGLWRVVPEAEYVASGSSDLFRIDVVLSKDNGDNTSTFPAAPDSTIQHGKTHTFISVPSASTLGTTSLIGRPAYILVTETETIYAVPRFGFTDAGSANGFARISAERIW